MGREFGCPWPKYADARVVLPDVWLGEHAAIRDKAITEAEKYESESITRFAIALSLCEDWENIPGLDGPPDKWDFVLVPLKVISWLAEIVLADFAADLKVPKVS